MTKIARPLPVEYLLIDVPVASAKDPIRTFHRGSPEFPVENRPMEGHLQVRNATSLSTNVTSQFPTDTHTKSTGGC